MTAVGTGLTLNEYTVTVLSLQRGPMSCCTDTLLDGQDKGSKDGHDATRPVFWTPSSDGHFGGKQTNYGKYCNSREERGRKA